MNYGDHCHNGLPAKEKGVYYTFNNKFRTKKDCMDMCNKFIKGQHPEDQGSLV